MQVIIELLLSRLSRGGRTKISVTSDQKGFQNDTEKETDWYDKGACQTENALRVNNTTSTLKEPTPEGVFVSIQGDGRVEQGLTLHFSLRSPNCQ